MVYSIIKPYGIANFMTYRILDPKYVHNFSLELEQSKTPPATLCWIKYFNSKRHYVFFNPRFCKLWDCPNPSLNVPRMPKRRKKYFELFF